MKQNINCIHTGICDGRGETGICPDRRSNCLYDPDMARIWTLHFDHGKNLPIPYDMLVGYVNTKTEHCVKVFDRRGEPL